MLSTEEVTRAADLERYREEWAQLFARTHGATFFQSCEWLDTWLERFWKGGTLAFLFIRRDSRLVGFAPLVVDQAGCLWSPRSVALAANEHTLEAGILCAEDGAEILDEVIRHLRATRGGVRLVLTNIGIHSPLLVDWLPTVARRHRLVTSSRPASLSPVVCFPADWEAYLQSRASHVRAEIRRKNRRVEDAGAIEVCVSPTTQAECARAMDDVLVIERNSWKQAAGSSLALHPEKERFSLDLAQRCSANGWFRLHLLYLGSKPVAYVYGVACRSDLYVLQTSLDEAYRNLSPGTALFAHVLREASREHLRVFLGAIPAESRDLHSLRWKSELATDLFQRVSVCVSSWEQFPWRWREAYARGLKPFVRAMVPAVTHLKRPATRSEPGNSAG
jgi:CelD/BcsL family acetyltransferase involved in cellulose biosynthesis